MGQGIAYVGLRSLRLHPSSAKALGHKKSINTRVAEVNSLIKKIRAAVPVGRDVWDDIVLITVLEGLPEEYDSDLIL